MANILDWNSNREFWIRILKQQSDQGVDDWLKRMQGEIFEDHAALRAWLKPQGVTGYAATLLVYEHFGYPDFVVDSAETLLHNQYADRPHLRPIYDALIAAVDDMGDFTIQMRKSYVSLVTPRRTFARIKPSTKKRVDVGLRLDGVEPGDLLKPCRMQDTMKVQLGLTSVDDLDKAALSWIQRAYNENC